MKMLQALLLCIAFNTCAQSLSMDNYVKEVSERRKGYSKRANENITELDTFMDGHTHVIITQLTSFHIADADQDTRKRIKDNLHRSLGQNAIPLYCDKKSVVSRSVRRLGITMEYRFVDADNETIETVLIDGEACRE
ncbi:hypothetical protein [Salinimonas iocasae]|uniref:Uncharacterized protein n=1 Tax=Salinimonas iocasae TaxID=2572577 RepID=A0A5B7YHE1_9ALTE|nr:hypothetical protein [Salinimonas iocasae]QCZ94925.1 hypothetical protein FBQ74_16240 [Salinimonas iocasae]